MSDNAVLESNAAWNGGKCAEELLLVFVFSYCGEFPKFAPGSARTLSVFVAYLELLFRFAYETLTFPQ